MGFRPGQASLFFIFLLIFSFVNESAEARRGRGGGCSTCGGRAPVIFRAGGFQSMPSGSACRTCVAPSSFSSMGTSISPGPSAVSPAGGAYPPGSGAAQPLGQNSQSFGDSTSTGHGGEGDEPAPGRLAALTPIARSTSEHSAKDTSQMTEEEKAVEALVDAAPTTKEIIFQLGQLEAAEIIRKEETADELEKITDPEAKKKRGGELILALKEALTKKWTALIEGLTKRSEKDGDRRLKNIAKVLQTRLDSLKKLFDETSKNPLDEEGLLHCVVCENHHDAKEALAKVGFTTAGEKEPKFMGDFVSVDGKNYRLFIDKKMGTPYYSERGLSEAKADTFAHNSPVNEAIAKFYEKAQFPNEADKSLVTSLTKHLSAPAPTVAAPPVVPATAVTPVASRGVASSNARADEPPTRQQTTPVTAGIGPTNAAKLAPPTIQVGYCAYCVGASSVYRSRFETLKRQLREAWPNANFSFYNAGVPAHVSIKANGKALTGNTPLYDDSTSLVSLVRNSLGR